MCAMNPRLLRPLASGFNPRSIAGLGAWFDASDLSTLSQTSDGTTAVTSNSDPVAYWKDKVTGVALTQGTDANRPLWLADGIGGKPGLDFDGTNDVLSATSGSLMGLFRNVGAGTVITVHRFKSTNTALGFVFFASTGTSSTAGRFALTRESSAGTRYSLGSRRTDAQSSSSALTAAGTLGTDATISASIYRVSAAQISFRLDGGDVLANASFQDAGNTSDTNSQQVAIGGVSGASVFADLVMCEMLAWPRELTTAEIQKIEGYLAWKWGVQSQLPYDHPYAKSFPGFGSQTVPTDADTLTYLAAVKAADGTGVEVGVANAVDDFVTGCKSDGIWDAIKASCILAGARTLAGALVPLRGTAPTNNNFVSGDYNRETGLKGGTSGKHLDSNRPNDADAQDDNHNAVYITEANTLSSFRVYFEAASASNTNQALQVSDGTMFVKSRNASATNADGSPTGLLGVSRSGAAGFDFRINGATTAESGASSAPPSDDVNIFARGGGTLAADARMAFYSIGEALDLEDLDTRVSALITEIGNAL